VGSGAGTGTGNGVAAVIFDMDGVLIDSEPLWRIAEVEALNAAGVPITLQDAVETTGLRTDEVVEHWYARFPWDTLPKKEVEARIITRVIALVRERGGPTPGVFEALDRLGAHYPLAVASSSASEIIAAVLETLGIGGRFAITQSAEHEPFGKPHPGVYIEAARRLNIEPWRCLAIEDSPNGVIAAKAARMKCIAIPDPALRDDRRYHAADAVVSSLSEVDLDLVRQL
jgi:mannitol-1-/sugar-/sorbitol-6-/2-deoxyglucose-6-phosphatase